MQPIIPEAGTMIRISQQPPTLFQLIFPELISLPSTVLKQYDLLNCCDFPTVFIFFTYLTVLGLPLEMNLGHFISQKWWVVTFETALGSCLQQLVPLPKAPCGKKADCPSFADMLCIHHPYQKLIAGFTVKVDDFTRDLKPYFKPFFILKSTILFYLPALW